MYAVLLGAYLCLHCLNILKFDTGIISGTAVSDMLILFQIRRIRDIRDFEEVRRYDHGAGFLWGMA